MTNSIYTEIKKRIKLAESGTVFLTLDFTDLATTSCTNIILEFKRMFSGINPKVYVE